MINKPLLAYAHYNEVKHINYDVKIHWQQVHYKNFEYKYLILFGSCGYLTYSMPTNNLIIPSTWYHPDYNIPLLIK